MDLFGCCLVFLVGVPLNGFSSVTQFTIFLKAIYCDMEFLCLFVMLKPQIFKFFTWKEALELTAGAEKLW